MPLGAPSCCQRWLGQHRAEGRKKPPEETSSTGSPSLPSLTENYAFFVFPAILRGLNHALNPSNQPSGQAETSLTLLRLSASSCPAQCSCPLPTGSPEVARESGCVWSLREIPGRRRCSRSELMSFGKAQAGRSWVRTCMGRNSRGNAAGILGADISVPPLRGCPTPFCSVAFPEAMRHGLMASGICHLMQTTFHQGDPHPAAGAACLITPGALPAGARWGGLQSLLLFLLFLLLLWSDARPGRCLLQGQGPNVPRQGTDGQEPLGWKPPRHLLEENHLR